MRRFDCRAARELLERAVQEYKPSLDIQDLVWARRGYAAPVPAAAGALESKVTELSSRRSRQPPG
jgi:hypothetical protein